jgi:hypothetical protein
LNPTSSYTISRNSKREFVFNVVSNQSTSFFFFKFMARTITGTTLMSLKKKKEVL